MRHTAVDAAVSGVLQGLLRCLGNAVRSVHLRRAVTKYSTELAYFCNAVRVKLGFRVVSSPFSAIQYA